MFIANKVDAPPVISKDLIRAHDKEVTRSTKYSFRTRTTSYYSRIVLGTTAQWRYSVEHIWLPIELVMVCEGLLVLSDSRISKDDVCAAIEHLCVEWRCNCVMLFLRFFFCFSFCFSFVFTLILYFVYDIDNSNCCCWSKDDRANHRECTWSRVNANIRMRNVVLVWRVDGLICH